MLKSAHFVLDCSVTMAWCFEDEVTPYSENIFESLKHSKAITPSLWLLEVANVLLVAQRKKRITKLQSFEFKDSLNQLPIEIDNAYTTRMNSIIEIAQENQLSIYDATYLEMSLYHQLPIATLDKAIISAAKKIHVKLV